MNKKQLVMIVLVASFLGGVVSVLGYNFFFREKRYQRFEDIRLASFSNYTADTNVALPEGLNFIYAANVTTPAVVHVRSSYDAKKYPGNPFDELFGDYFGNSYPMQQPGLDGAAPQSSGSGVIISEDGYIVTNNHVVQDAVKIEIVLNDKRSYTASLIGSDPTTDIALLKIKEKGLYPIKFGNSDLIPVGSWVLAVGNPFNLTSTVTAGIVSAKARSINVFTDAMAIESFIQTDAVVNMGNSGGALVNLRGELIGINTAIASTTGAFAGYAFAVPVSLVHKVTEDLMKFGQVQRAMLGVSVLNLDATLAGEKGIKNIEGVYVDSVVTGSTAHKAGIQNGDVIISINGSAINNPSRLQEIVGTYSPGDKSKITYLRNKKIIEKEVTFQNQKGTTRPFRKKNLKSPGQ